MPLSEGEAQKWLVAIPTSGSEKITHCLLVAFDAEPPCDAETLKSLLSLARELVAAWLTSETSRHMEHLARSFRIATLGELAAGIAHEINNPLQVIMGNAELLLDSAELSERMRERLTDILQAAECIRDLTKAIIHFADARRATEKELLDINQVVQEAVQLVAYSLVRNGVQVNLDLAPSLPPILAQRGDLEEIIVQLMRNAGEAIVDSGKGSSVTLRTSLRGDQVRLEVEDDGPGILPELRDRIFDPFVTTKAAKGGTGLGLAIVHNLVTANDGRIWLEDTPSGGARFVVVFPSWQRALSNSGENPEQGG